MEKLTPAQMCMIQCAIEDTLKEALSVTLERWVTEEELKRQFSFTQTWIDKFGQFLCRTKPEGAKSWLYPVHHINRMMHDGTIAKLTA